MTVKEFVLENLGKEVYVTYEDEVGMIVGYSIRFDRVIVSFPKSFERFASEVKTNVVLLVHSPLNVSYSYCKPRDLRIYPGDKAIKERTSIRRNLEKLSREEIFNSTYKINKKVENL